MAWLNEDADRDRRQLFEAREALVELQAEIRELRAVPLAPPPPADRVADVPHRIGRQAPELARTVTVRRCFAAGCPFPATCRVQGPRGVERDACESHARPGRKPHRWRVVCQY